ncbi:3-keto-steroid reductase [Lachnellula occidentalis]|uniref:3-keto-steroid reductase n=1 Tax=Lachnellula occidentalis TaxID=215460 RepID=A0A8H8RBU6_9HELO|nr:3-keto-steroid reductase [Lachnellula occidentalis]
MGLPPWETSDSQLFALITGANSGLGFAIASRLIDEFLTSPSTSPNKHLILVLCTRTPIKTRYTISRLRSHLRRQVDYSPFATSLREKAKAQGTEYRWEHVVQRVHFLGVEADLCNLRSVYALADRLVNGTVGSPDATTYDGLRLPHGSPGTQNFSENATQGPWALSQERGSEGVLRSWGWGLSGLRLPRLDVVILSAGMGGWIGVDWLPAVRDVMLDTLEAVTWPKFKLPNVGAVVRSQSSFEAQKASDDEKQPLLSDQAKPDEPPLGEVFCSNVFGHYILAHELMPLLSRPASSSSQVGGKIIWVSSVEALSEHLNIDDIQGLESRTPYEDSKRMIDVLSITSSLPSTQRITASFFDSSNTVTETESNSPSAGEEKLPSVKPKMYLTHPGIFASEIMPLNVFLVWIYKFVFLFVRWLGSPWHSIEPYKAAVAPVWLALTDIEELDAMEGQGAKKAKWGSATDRGGEERVMKTEVGGWGWDGTIESADDIARRKGRKRGVVDVTKEAREDFEVLGIECWSQMEDLRKKWEGILGVRSSKKV